MRTMMTKSIKEAILLLVSVAVSACACAKEQAQTGGGDDGGTDCKTTVKISPDRTTVLKNPLNGWVMYVSGTADPSYFDTKIYVPDLGREVYVRDYASACYIRTGWKNLNPAKGQYAWDDPTSSIGKLVNRAEELGLPIAFRVVVDGRDQRENTPQFVFDDGAEYWLSDAKYPDRKTPIAIDPIWRKHYETFVKAFAARFNDPQKTAFIDAYGLGKWGEGHNVCYEQNNAVSDRTSEYKAETMRWITGLYADNFTKIPLVINYHRQIGHPVSEGRNAQPDSETVLQIALDNGYCLRSDAFGMNNQDWGYNDWEKAYAMKWALRVPILMEGGYIVSSHSYWNDPAGYRKGYPGDVRAGEFNSSMEAKVNTMDFRVGDETKSWFEDAFEYVGRFVAEGGYRLYPTSVSFPSAVKFGDNVTVGHSWTNLGWGYCPVNLPQWDYKYKVGVALLDSNDKPVKVVVATDTDLSKWLKGEIASYKTAVEIKGVAVGAYTWAVGIVDTTRDNAIGIRPAAAAKNVTADGWVRAGTVTVSSR